MELTVIGCSGSLSGPRSPASSYLVTAPYQGRTFSLLVDLGAGAFGSLYGVADPAGVDAIAISHLHPDHCIDLCAFHVASRYAPDAPWKPVDLYGPPGTIERIGRAYDAGPGSEEPDDLTSSFTFHHWQDVQQIGPFTVSTARMAHPVPTYGMRIETDRGVLAYSADTGPTPALVELARDADLLLCEAAFIEDTDRPNPPGLHLSGADAARHAARAGANALMITHVPPWHQVDRVLAEARPHFTGPIEIATTHRRLAVSTTSAP